MKERVNDMRKRNKKITIRLSDEEFAKFDNLVERSHMSKEGLIRRLLEGAEIKEAPPVDVPLLMCEVKRVGNNINQILAIAYTKGFLDAPKLKLALEELKAVDQLIFDAYAGDG